MTRAARSLLGVTVLGLVASLGAAVPLGDLAPAAASAPVAARGGAEDPTGEPTAEPTQEPTQEPSQEPSGEPSQEPSQEPTEEPTERKGFVPRGGVVFNDPTVYERRRVILTKVIRTIRNTRKGQVIRIATWNLDDRPVARTLLRAHRRGVSVRIVVSGIVDNDNWDLLTRGLNRNRKDDSWARQCKGACRSRSNIMHAKIFLFSKVRHERRVSMFGSLNLTTPSGNRQWNDLVTVKGSPGLYKYLADVIDEYARDKPVRDPYDQQRINRTWRVTVFPARNRNPVARELRRVRCAAGAGAGNADGRTVVRIAVAGWFDTYGDAIAAEVRKLWDQGCDVKIVTTLAGRGINRRMNSTAGRGPVPMRQLSIDNNEDGIPERYLHLKSLAISGHYRGDPSAHVVFTGSPNWSSRAQRSDEIWLRALGKRGMTQHYIGHTDRLFASQWATARVSTRADLQRGVIARRGVGATLPEWFELE